MSSAKRPDGRLDLVSDTGWVFGWAWYPDRPQTRVEVEVLVDGHPAGSLIAEAFREDVAAAGFGDGNYGFSWPLPYPVMAMPREVTIAVRDKATGEVFPEPRPFRQKILADALQRITELESEVRLLNATIAGLARRGGGEALAAAELFRTVGGFFEELAAASAAGAPLAGLKPLGSAVADVTAGFAPFDVATGGAPDVTVLVDGAGPAAEVYATLRALHETQGGCVPEMFLLDDGAGGQAALLPLIVRGLRYARLSAPGAVARRNDAMRLGTGRVILYLGPGARPLPGWPLALARFDAEPQLAACAACATGADGLLVSAGAAVAGLGFTARGAALDPMAPEFRAAAAVDAVTGEAHAIRRASLARAGGLDEAFETPEAALGGFCLAAAAAGELVSFEPALAVRLAGPPPVPALEAARADAMRLRERLEIFRRAAA
jgi:hypothetical protein